MQAHKNFGYSIPKLARLFTLRSDYFSDLLLVTEMLHKIALRKFNTETDTDSNRGHEMLWPVQDNAQVRNY